MVERLVPDGTVNSGRGTREGGHAMAWFLASVATSSLGDGMRQAVVPLIAVGLTDRPGPVALIAGASYVPYLLVGPIAGVLVDRRDRLGILRAVELARGCAIAVLAAVAVLDGVRIGHLVALSLVLGSLDAVASPAAQAAHPQLLGRDRPELLARSNGLLHAADTLGHQFVAPPVGALLLSVGVPVALVGSATPYVASLLCILLLLRTRPPGPVPATQATSTGAGAAGTLRSLADGIRHLWSLTTIRWITLAAFATNLLFAAAASLLVVLAVDVLGLTEVQFSLILVAQAVGALLGAAAGAAAPGRLAPLLLGMSVAATGAATAAAGVAEDVWALALLMGAAAAGTSAFGVIGRTVRQLLIPDAAYGRLAATYRAASMGGIPIGALAGGAIATWGGTRSAFVLPGLGLVAVGLLLGSRWRRPSLRRCSQSRR